MSTETNIFFSLIVEVLKFFTITLILIFILVAIVILCVVAPETPSLLIEKIFDIFVLLKDLLGNLFKFFVDQIENLIKIMKSIDEKFNILIFAAKSDIFSLFVHIIPPKIVRMFFLF